MLFSMPNRMACGAKIVKNRIRQQYPEVFWKPWLMPDDDLTGPNRVLYTTG
jgi:hypothetical protein